MPNTESAVMRLFHLCQSRGWVMRLDCAEDGDVDLLVYEPEPRSGSDSGIKFQYTLRTDPETAADAALKYLDGESAGDDGSSADVWVAPSGNTWSWMATGNITGHVHGWRRAEDGMWVLGPATWQALAEADRMVPTTRDFVVTMDFAVNEGGDNDV